MVYLQEYPAPLIPRKQRSTESVPSSETDKAGQTTLVESDDAIYRDFSVTMPERWAQEVVQTIFWDVNRETDQIESSRAPSTKPESYASWNCIMHGYGTIIDHPLGSRCYFYLYPNRLEWRRKEEGKSEVLRFSELVSVEEVKMKDKSCVSLRARGREPLLLKFDSNPELYQWMKELTNPHRDTRRKTLNTLNVNFVDKNDVS
ncbi:beta-adrenergic receptor kinase 1-like [Scyliorhinus torazame]|uniref:beta-adrenergic receptor kinase 1-like n=1 Tax=Scyliorhinus torazame TaxID=75743 RepID=UPI003B5993DD